MHVYSKELAEKRFAAKTQMADYDDVLLPKSSVVFLSTAIDVI